MKILKSILILILLSNLNISCTTEDIVEESEINAIDNILATGEEDEEVDETEKG